MGGSTAGGKAAHSESRSAEIQSLPPTTRRAGGSGENMTVALRSVRIGFVLWTIALVLAACGPVAGGAEVTDAAARIDHIGFPPHPSDAPPDDAATTGPSDAAPDGGCTPPAGPIPYADSSDNAEFTDPPDCADCPGAFTGVEELDAALPPDATSLAVSGTAPGATSCEWYVIGGACGVTYGAAATDPDGGGAFQVTFPVFCGTNVVRIVCHNAAGARVLVRRVAGTECEGRDLRLTLSWDDQGTDMELHLIRPGGTINSETDDCTWFTCIPPKDLPWGPDVASHPRKDVDNVSTYGPENIYLDEAAPGIYHVLVEFWGGGAPSDNAVDVTIREVTVAHRTQTGLPVHFVWYVGTVEFPSGLFTPIDQLTDCTQSWRATTMGCDLPLP
jgi:hypothetical protein